MSRKEVNRIVLAMAILVVSLGLIYYQVMPKTPHRLLKTYFSYQESEVAELRKWDSQFRMTINDLYKWEEKAYELVGQNKLGSTEAGRLYAYLTTAQKDAAYLSFNTHGEFKGNIDSVSAKTLCLFFPEDCASLSLALETDPYSEELAQIVIKKVLSRIDEDKHGTRTYERPQGDQYWIARGVANGKTAGSWKTWWLSSGSEFPLSIPPAFGTAEDARQLEIVRQVHSNLDDQKKLAIAYWSGGPGTKRNAGLWLDKTGALLREVGADLEKTLELRALIATILADVDITAAHYKYTYWTQRPFMRDNAIKTYMPTPNYPGYPANATAIAAAAATCLAHYFPDKAATIETLAKEAGNSRIWSGIHFPVDVEQGADLGRSITREVLRRQEQTS